jgi:DNA polymerase-3 subunit epsilon
VKVWTGQPFLSIDLETTGVDPHTDRIVELAAVVIGPTGLVEGEYHRIVNPGVDIPTGASDIHGITTERARNEGHPADLVLADLALILDRNTWPVVIYNATFDWPFLICEAERHGVDLPAAVSILDPFLIDKIVDRYRPGSRKLVDVADHYGVELGDAAHGATADATAAAQVMRRIVECHPELGGRSLARLWMDQVAGHETWRAGYVEYRRGSDPSFEIAPGWPIAAIEVAA